MKNSSTTWRIFMKLNALLLGVPLLTQGVAAPAAGAAQAFSVHSPDLGTGKFDNKFVAKRFGCNGHNISPVIRWPPPLQAHKSLLCSCRTPMSHQHRWFHALDPPRSRPDPQTMPGMDTGVSTQRHDVGKRTQGFSCEGRTIF